MFESTINFTIQSYVYILSFFKFHWIFKEPTQIQNKKVRLNDTKTIFLIRLKATVYLSCSFICYLNG